MVEPEGAAGGDDIRTPAQPTRRYGIGAVDYHTGETAVLIRRRKRSRSEVAELLEALLQRHPTGSVYVAWDNSNTHEDDEIEAVGRASGRGPVGPPLPADYLQPVVEPD